MLKQKEAALQILTELCNDHPEYVYGQYLRGEEYLQRGDVKTAFESFRSALRSDDGDYRVWLGLGDCYVFQKDYKTAVHERNHPLPSLYECIQSSCASVDPAGRQGNGAATPVKGAVHRWGASQCE